MSTHNICFLGEIRKLYIIIWILFLARAFFIVPVQVDRNFLLVPREVGQVGHGTLQPLITQFVITRFWI